MTRVRLVHWSAAEARERIATLEAAGFTVDYASLENQRAMRQIRQGDPQAILIDLTRMPAQGRDLALWLRQQKSTRDVPLIIVEGAREKVEALEKLLPDATYTDWKRIRSAVHKAIAHPPKQPIVPESVFAGYSGTPLPRKLGIKPEMVVALVNAPPDFETTLGSLPEGVKLRPSGRGHRDLTLCFVRSRRELNRRIESLVKVASQGSVWIAWPKKASGVATNLTQADVRRTGLDAGLVDFKICAIDATWSGLCFARRRG